MTAISNPDPLAEPPADGRFNLGLVYDITEVLEKHGYRTPEPGPDGDESAKNRAYGSMLANLYRLVREFEGVTDEP